MQSLKRNEILLFATSSTDLGGTMLSESVRKRQMLYDITCRGIKEYNKPVNITTKKQIYR